MGDHRLISDTSADYVLKHSGASKQPIAFFGFAGAGAAKLVRQGFLEVVERRGALGTRYVRITDAGRAALNESQSK